MIFGVSTLSYQIEAPSRSTFGVNRWFGGLISQPVKHRPRLIASCYPDFGRIDSDSHRRLVCCRMRSYREVEYMVI